MEAVKRCQALTKPIGGDITFKHKNKLANQQPEEKQKWLYIITGAYSEASGPQCSGRTTVLLSGRM